MYENSLRVARRSPVEEAHPALTKSSNWGCKNQAVSIRNGFLPFIELCSRLHLISRGWWSECVRGRCCTTASAKRCLQVLVQHARSNLSLIRVCPSLLFDQVNLGPENPTSTNSQSSNISYILLARLRLIDLPPFFSSSERIWLKSPTNCHGD